MIQTQIKNQRVQVCILLLVLFYCGAVFCAVPLPQAQSAPKSVPTVILDNDTEFMWVEKSLAYMLESKPMSHIEASRTEASQWTVSSSKMTNLGAQSSPAWFRFDISNEAGEDIEWLMEISWPYLDRIEVFIFSHSTGKWHGPNISGNLVPMAERIIAHRTFLFPLPLAIGEQATVYIRASSGSKLIVPIRIWRKERLQENNSDYLVLLGIFFGILIVMIFYNFFLFISTRDQSFLYFSLFVFSIIFYVLMPSGLGSLYFWDHSVWIKSHSYGLFSSLCFLTAAIFIRRYLWLKRYGGWILKMSNTLIAYWSLSVIVFIFWTSPLLIVFEDLIAFISTIAGMATALYCWIKKDASARLFSVAWIFLTVGTILLILSLSGVMERSWITSYSQLISFAIVVIFLSFALAERINRERDAKKEAQKNAMILSQKISDERAAKLDAYSDMLEVQRKTSEELELRVKDRSAQLAQAMQQLETANQELSKLNITDALTQLYNRRYFDQVLVEEIQRAHRNAHPLSVIMVDIDHFKSINDTYGHLIGDECLRLVAKTIQQNASKMNNLVARYGGEEFALILPQTSSEDALMIADQTRIAVQNLTYNNRGRAIDLRVSLGVAGWIPRPNETAEKLIQTADKALYHAKQKGRNRVVIAEVD